MFFKFFDKLEDKIRRRLSRRPIIYALVGSIGIVLIWRGIWMIADDFNMSGWFSALFGMAITMATGLFVSYFIGDTILISGLKGQKKMTDKTEKDIKEEEAELGSIRTTIREIKKEVDVMKEVVEHEHMIHHHPDGKGEGK